MTGEPNTAPVEQIPASDWTDMDLLTRDLARDLLSGEIAAEEEALSRARDGAGLSGEARTAAIELRSRRITAMRRRRDDLTTDPVLRFD